MGSRIPVERQEVKKAKGLYAAGYSVQEISLELYRYRKCQMDKNNRRKKRG